jgi:hypothetical protein
MSTFLVLVLMPGAVSIAQAQCSTSPAAHVIELYTSEGCSSCPPAEEWLRSVSRGNGDVVTLEYHVDYWDSLGWHDRFSNARYTRRQQQFAAASSKSIVYTPEVVVDGHEWRSWAREALPTTQRSAFPFSLRVTSKSPLRARITADADVGATHRWYLAITETNLESTITAGENRGSTLAHDHVVRALSGPVPISDEIVLDEMPPNIERSHAWIVALVVDAQDRAIAAERAPLGECGAPGEG